METKEKMLHVVTIAGVRAYVDDKGVAHLNAEDVAHGLGFVRNEKKSSPTSGRKTYTSIRWERINGYLKDFADSPLVGKDFPKKISAGDFISETVFYLLAMKANNDAAKEFQWKVANEIIPSIRKTGCYSLNQPDEQNPQVIAAVDISDLQRRIEVLEMSFQGILDALERNTAVQLSKIERAEKLLAIVEKIRNDEVRDKVILHAANLINGKAVF